MEDPHSCCKSGHQHNGASAGKEIKIEGKDVYLAEPSTPTDKAILFVSDAFGWSFINSRLLADFYSKELGVKVYLPDFFEGKAVPSEVLLVPGMAAKYDFSVFMTANSRAVRGQQIIDFARALKDKHGVKTLAAVGYCWGGLGTVLLTGTDIIVAGVVAHPSLLSVPADIEQITQPVLFLCAEKDFIFTEPQRLETEAILKKKEPTLYSKVKAYSGVEHGFAVRGNPDNKTEFEAAADAKKEAVAFFKKYL